MSRAAAVTAVRNALTNIGAIPVASRTIAESLQFDDFDRPGLYINPSVVFQDDVQQLGGGVTVKTTKRLDFSVTLTVKSDDFAIATPLLSMLTYYDAIEAAIQVYMDAPSNTDGTGVVGMYLRDGEGGWAPDVGALHMTFSILVLVA